MPQTFPLPYLLVAALCLAGLVTAGAVVAAEPPATAPAPAVDDSLGDTVTVTNTTNYVFPAGDGPSRQSYVRSDVDVAGAVATDVERLQGQHEVLRFEHRYDARNESEGRLVAVDETIDRTEARLDALNARQETLFSAYTDGSLSTDAFLRRLSRLDTAASESRNVLQRVRSRVRADLDTRLPVSTETRLAALRADLVAIPGRISTQVTATVRGEADPTTLYLQGTGNGLVLATVDETEYRRQATLRDEYTPDAPNQFALAEEEPISLAFDRARELYPWVSENLQSINRIAGFGDSDVYLIDLSHPHGDLRSYIHGGSTNVFHEEHRQNPDSLPVRLTASAENGSLGVSVAATAETGPMRVTVTSATTDVPTDAVVRVNGQPVGSTGGDGELWTIRPTGSFTVNATSGDGTSVVVSP
ncbi:MULTISPECIES: DUF7096 domain-containing protein [Salinibaculum]|uniref:DUF7096 domain-containing protein n=1 Tax=Salinibaculum TaxID=2732368 RepID=UPI0030CC9D37